MRELLPLATKYVIGFNGDPEKIKRFVSEQWVPMEVMRLCYHTMVNANEIVPLEKLPDQEKKRLKEIIKVWGWGDTEQRMTQVKAVYLIEQFMNKKINL